MSAGPPNIAKCTQHGSGLFLESHIFKSRRAGGEGGVQVFLLITPGRSRCFFFEITPGACFLLNSRLGAPLLFLNSRFCAGVFCC